MTTQRTRLGLLLGLVLGLVVGMSSEPSRAQSAPPLVIGWLGQEIDRPPTLANVPPPPENEGLIGARLGVADTNSTGRFLKLSYRLEERILPPDGDPAQALADFAAQGISLVITGLEAPALERALQAPAAATMTFLNAYAMDDALRGEKCQTNVLHTIPARAMLTDGLAQALIVKRWTRWLLITGPQPADALYAAAIKRSAQKFGAKIVEEKQWTGEGDLRRSAQTELVAFTRSKDYDVVVVADEAGDFGDYLPFNTDLPRPVVGTQGLMPVAWHWAVETWGAGQLQNRFERAANRPMQSRDWAGWMAARALGEASTRAASTDPAQVTTALFDPTFSVAGFKGVPLSFRPWDQQMRQPILLAWARALVSVAPFDGFLHPTNDLDTLGMDRPESACSFAKAAQK